MELKFKSIFKEEFDNMILFEKAMGFKNNNKLFLYDLDNYFSLNNKKDKTISEKDFNNYIYDFTISSIDIYRRYLIILKFCKFLIRFGNTNIFFEEKNFETRSVFEPHIYDKNEMTKILSFIDTRKYKYKNYSYEYPVLFRLLYSTGLRISEALNIKFKDVSLDNDSIDIILSKENISRRIYISSSMKKVLIKYFNLVNFYDDEYIFKSSKRNALLIFKECVKKAHIKTDSIRLHDLRHSFAVNAFDKIIKKNIEPEEALLYLEKYMGHSTISSTEYYLHMTDNMKREIIDTMNNKIPNLYPKVKDDMNDE